jgi:hypothetical protein
LKEVIASDQALGIYDLLDLETFKYSKYLRMIEDLFGTENLCVVVFEDLVVDQQGLVARIAEYIGTSPPSEMRSDKVNVGISGRSVSLRRFLNRVFVMSDTRDFALIPRPPGFRSLLRVVARFMPGDVNSLKACLRDLVDFYLEDNLYIDKRYNLGFEENAHKSSRWLGHS